jgi:hypothetical protein
LSRKHTRKRNKEECGDNKTGDGKTPALLEKKKRYVKKKGIYCENSVEKLCVYGPIEKMVTYNKGQERYAYAYCVPYRTYPHRLDTSITHLQREKNKKPP